MARPDVDEAPFDGTVGPGASTLPGPTADERTGAPLEVGATVRLIAGPRRGATAELVAIEEVPLPAGGTIRLARVRRPRAGESMEFLGSLVTVTP